MDNYIAKDVVNIRSGPGTSYPIVATPLAPGMAVEMLNESNGWIQHSEGWSLGRYFIKQSTGAKAVNYAASAQNNDASDIANTQARDTNQRESEDYTAGRNATNLKTLVGLYGLPHQFIDTVDLRPGDSVYGRTYQDKIITDMPCVLFTAGKPDFMAGVSSSQKKNLEQDMYRQLRKDGESERTLEDLLEGTEARYYKFTDKMTDYYTYVNDLCRMSAIYLGIGDMESPINNLKYADIHWGNLDNSELYSFFGGHKNFVSFFIDGNSSISESASNSTTQSMLANTINGMSGMSKELQFLFGVATAGKMTEEASKSYDEQIGSFTGGAANPNAILSRLGSGKKTIQSGANLVFPEIWSESSYSKSYNIDIKLKSPYGDKESVFLNVLVPFYHIVALSLPRTYSVNGVQSPFILRAFCRGIFNCDMGIVESFSFKKGGSNDGWNVDGIPLEIDVSLSIKDLYQSLGITSTDIRLGSMTKFLENTSLLDFIATTSGININKPDFDRKLETLLAVTKNGVTDFIPTQIRSVKESLYVFGRDKLGGVIGWFQ